MNGITKKNISNKLLAEIGVIIEEERKLPKRVRTGKQQKRGIGFTSKAAHESKARQKMAKKSRKINVKISNKKSRPTGSKKRV